MTEASDRAMYSRIVQDWYRTSGLSWAKLAARAGVSKVHLKRVAYGGGLASMEVTAKLAEAIPAPSLVSIMGRIRSRRCPRCGVGFQVESHGRHRVYCSDDCQNKASRERTHDRQYRGVVSELRTTRDRLVVLSDAVGAFCRSCEPDGQCQMAECELRAVSPLPLARRAIA